MADSPATVRHAPIEGRFFKSDGFTTPTSFGMLAVDARGAIHVRGILDARARLDVRDDLLKSTPLGWACRWGNVEIVKLFLARGADPVEADAEPWARPRAWAERMQRTEIVELLRGS